MSDSKMFSVDKFLGINESADGDTELKMGEAARMENFAITDALNLTLRPGIQRLDSEQERDPAPILGSWAGYIGSEERFLLCDFQGGKDRLWLYGVDRTQPDGHCLICHQEGALGLTSPDDPMVKIFPFSGKLYIMSREKTVAYQGGTFQEEAPYIPLVITGADPSGGGTSFENLNLLSGQRRIEYSSDGTSTAYTLPEEAVCVDRVSVDNVAQTAPGTYDPVTHTFTFASAPAKGVANVEITYSIAPEKAEANRLQILRCTLTEAYNGSTDTRLFVAGDGTNICYYSGVTQSGEPCATYFPAMNEVAVDVSGSPITGLVRHYSKLLVFKPDGAFTISYEAVTLTGGDTVAGFYLRSANREFGNDATGQVVTVDNYPRTISKGSVYEWRITSSFYRDERYAKRVSDRVCGTLSGIDTRNVVACDDTFTKTYYLFTNDDSGTVLVNRYGLNRDGVWFLYRGDLLKNVRSAFVFAGKMVFVRSTEAFFFDDSLTVDVPETPGGETTAIKAVWESGNMSFGAAFRRKYSSYIYVSLLPESSSSLTVTASTDRRESYMEKTVQSDVFSFENWDFDNLTFSLDQSPKIQRIRLKVKKFVYYKLIFRVDSPGTQATILGFDQQVRYSSMVK